MELFQTMEEENELNIFFLYDFWIWLDLSSSGILNPAPQKLAMVDNQLRTDTLMLI